MTTGARSVKEIIPTYDRQSRWLLPMTNHDYRLKPGLFHFPFSFFMKNITLINFGVLIDIDLYFNYF